MALTVAPFAAQAETWNIYGWQNHSWEFVDIDGGRSFDRIQSNAGNIGFAASVPTGMNDISVNVRCEQFTYFNHFAGGTGWCNRNSKIGLSHPMMGEIMFATWLLPYNEGVAQWVDPFYDAGADSHTSIMGSVGAHTIFYNTGDFDIQASGSGPTTGFGGAEFNYAGGGYDTGFNRRQENIIQYWSPNWNGFVFRFAWTAGNRDETPLLGNEVDPVIRSSSLAYTNGPLWLAVTWQDHEDWTAVSVGEMESSDAESMRLAGRYIMDLGDGMSVQLSAMWETLEYEFNGVTSVDAAMRAFGYGNFADSYTLQGAGGEPLTFNTPADLVDTDETPMPPSYDDTYTRDQKTKRLWLDIFTGEDNPAPDNLSRVYTEDDPATTDQDESGYAWVTTAGGSECTDTPATDCHTETHVLTAVGIETDAREYDQRMPIYRPDDSETEDVDENAGWKYVEALGKYVAQLEANHAESEDDTDDPAEATLIKNYNALKAEAMKRGMAMYRTMTADERDAYDEALAAATEDFKKVRPDATGNVKVERDAWMVSGKIKMGGPIDFRFSYMDADDLEVSCGSCSGDWDETAADAWNVGVFYTMPAGTELRLTYSEVSNDDNGTYGQGISGTGLGSPGAEIEMFALGIVHWFD